MSEKPCHWAGNSRDCDFLIDEYLDFLEERDIKTIVVLLTNRQLQQYYDFDLLELYKSKGYKVIHYPIVDFSTPKDFPSFNRLMKEIAQEIKSGNILVHCSAGLGRTGLVASGFAIYAGYKYDDAIRLVRKVRIGCVETKEQVRWLEKYALFRKAKSFK